MENGEGERDEISRFLKKKKVQKWLLYYFDNSFMSNDRTPIDKKKIYIIGIQKTI